MLELSKRDLSFGLLLGAVLLASATDVVSLEVERYPHLSYGIPVVLEEASGVEPVGAVVTSLFGYPDAESNYLLAVGLANTDGKDTEVRIGVPVRITLPGTQRSDGSYYVSAPSDPRSMAEAPGWKGYRDTGLLAVLAEVGIDAEVDSGMVEINGWSIELERPQRRQWRQSMSNALSGYGETAGSAGNPFAPEFTVSATGAGTLTGTPTWIESSATEDAVHATIWYEYTVPVRGGRTQVVSVASRAEYMREPTDEFATHIWHSTFAPEGSPRSVYVISGEALPDLDTLTPLGRFGGGHLYQATAAAQRSLYLTRRIVTDYVYPGPMMGDGGPNIDVTTLPTASGPFESPYPQIQGIRASSSLSGNATVLGTRPGSEGDTQWYRSSYEPASLFDGITSNAWVEAVDGPGIGEWVEFELTRPTVGLSIHNGIQMYEEGLYQFDFSGHSRDHAYYESIFEQNNRVRTLILEALGTGFQKRIELEDSRTPTRLDTLYLPAGRYRLTVEAVYPGSRWDDTCLAELELGPATVIGDTGDEEWLLPMLERIGLLDRQLDRPELR